jgi:uncharacterized protein involved in exopolysaccharide biosynthesis/Mrp family chromosome partitioning ATPase
MSSVHPAANNRYFADLAPAGTVDVRRLSTALLRHWARLLAAAIIAGGLMYLWASSITPLYRSESRVLIENYDTPLTRLGNAPDQRPDIDERAVASQVQLILSRDLARDVVRSQNLGELSEFDPIGNEASIVRRVLGIFGLVRDPSRLSAEERVLEVYYKNLAVYAVQGSRVIAVEFTSENPDVAARVANAVADHYIALQQSVRQMSTREASNWLQSEITRLRSRVAEAEARVEEFRTKAGLFIAPNSGMITTQELGELNTLLVTTRSRQAEAEAKAGLIRDVLANGRPIESLDIANAELIRRLLEQRVTLQAQMAAELRTLLPGHPRIKELKAQLDNLETQTRLEAERIARAFENEAKVLATQVESVQARINTQRGTVSTANEQEVELRALDREARVQRDLLEQFLSRYREADARESSSLPPDARVISRAGVSNVPYFPKVLPMVLIAMAGTLFLGVGFIITAELLRAGDPESEPVGAAPVVSGAVPVFGSIERAKAQTPGPSGTIEAADARIIQDLAQHLASVEPGETALRILVTTAVEGIDSGLVALELARALADCDRKSIIVDSGAGNGSLNSALLSADVAGLTDLLTGAASFTQAIHRDRDSGVHIIPAGQTRIDPKHKSRMSIVVDALGFTYNFVIMVAPSTSDEGSHLPKLCKAAIVVAAGQAADPQTVTLHQTLIDAGIDDVVVLLMTAETPPPGREAA